VPADDVPQYWHRAAGFEDTFIAHAESRQRVRFALEHAVAPYADVPMVPNITVKNINFLFISLFKKEYIKKCLGT